MRFEFELKEEEDREEDELAREELMIGASPDAMAVKLTALIPY